MASTSLSETCTCNIYDSDCLPHIGLCSHMNTALVGLSRKEINGLMKQQYHRYIPWTLRAKTIKCVQSNRWQVQSCDKLLHTLELVC